MIYDANGKPVRPQNRFISAEWFTREGVKAMEKQVEDSARVLEAFRINKLRESVNGDEA